MMLSQVSDLQPLDELIIRRDEVIEPAIDVLPSEIFDLSRACACRFVAGLLIDPSQRLFIDGHGAILEMLSEL